MSGATIVGQDKVKSITMHAVVTRADGRREDLGVIAEFSGTWALWFKRRFQHAWHVVKGERGMATLQVNTGRAIVTNRLRGGGTEPLNIGWGTGAGTTAAGDTTLFGEKDVDLASGAGSRTVGTSSQVTTSTTNDTYQVTGTRTATGAGSVTNAGLFDNVTIGSGSLYMKGDFVSIGLSIGDSIAFTIKVQYS
jgi:hypothetical protein